MELLAGTLSNSGRTPLRRAIDAYRKLELRRPAEPQPRRRKVRQAKFLRAAERAQMAERYEAGAKVKELAVEFGIDRRTVSHHLHQEGVTVRRPNPPSEDLVRKMAQLYESGLPLAVVAERVGFSAFVVQRSLREQGVVIRPKTRRKKQAPQAIESSQF